MSTLSQFTGGGSLIPTGRFNGEVSPVAFNTGACNAGSTTAFAKVPNGKTVLSGACVAATYKTALSLSGKGVIDYLSIGGAGSASTITVKVTVDGAVILDGTYAQLTSNFANIIGAQYYFTPTDNYPTAVDFQAIPFNTSLLVEIKSSLSETDQTRICYRYFPR